MFDYSLTIIALIAALMIPGPTNALLASSAQHVGISKSLRLIPAELIGYIYAMALWWLFIRLTVDFWPAIDNILHFFSVCYVFWMAFNLWKMKQLHHYSQKYLHIRSRQLFVSAFKNPKSILFSVGIFPDSTWSSLSHYILSMLIFSAILVPSALFWLCYGSQLLTGKVKGLDQQQLYRGSALFLVVCMLPIIVRLLSSF